MKRTRTKRIVLDGVLTAMALVIWVVEIHIPLPLPVPGVKLGLSNVVTLFALFALGPVDALVILLVRIGIGAAFGGSLTSFLFSLTGGLLCYLVTLLLKLVVRPKQIWVLGVIGAIFHNMGQIVIAMGLTKTTGLVVYLPVLIAAGIGTGLFTGLVAQSCYLALRRHPLLAGLKGGVEKFHEPADLPDEDAIGDSQQKK